MILELNNQIKEFLNIVDLIPDQKEKLTFLEQATELYKSQRDRKTALVTENENLTKEIVSIKEKMKNADGLVRIYQRLIMEVKKFGDLSKDQNLTGRITYIKNKRVSGIMNILIALQGTLAGRVNKYLNKNSRGHLKAKLVLVLSVLIIPISIIIYLLTSNTQIIYIGSVALLINLFIFFLINIFSDKKTEIDFNSHLGLDYSNSKSYGQLISKLNEKKEDAFLINAAWVNALRAEAKRVYQSINQSLDGQNYNEVADTIKERELKIRANEAEINGILDSMLSAEEYLKLRREIDILKIEIDSEKTDGSQSSEEVVSTNEVIIKNLENLANPLKSYLKKFFESIDKRYIIKYV